MRYRFIKTSIAIALLIATPIFGAAQVEDGKHPSVVGRKYSRLPDEGRKSLHHLRTIKKAGHFTANAGDEANFPASVDWRPNCPAVYDQGQLGSCTANASAGLFEFDQMRQSGRSFMPSRLFIYYNERALENTVTEDSGASLSDAVVTLCQSGVCRESQAGGAPFWPYADQGNQFKEKPTAACYADALNYRDLDDRSLASVNQDVNSMKAALVQGPIIGGISVYSSFEGNDVATSGMVPMPNTSSEQLLGGHALMFVGYDDAKQSFILRNSWGAGWGLQGYAYIPYGYLTNGDLASDFWKISKVNDAPIDPQPTPPQPKPSGKCCNIL